MNSPKVNWFSRQVTQMRAGGVPVARRKLGIVARGALSAAEYGINALWAVPGVFVIRAIRLRRPVHFSPLYGSRIGHFVGDSSLHLARHNLKAPEERATDLYWFSMTLANRHWARMVRRKLYVRRWVKYVAAFDRLIPGGETGVAEIDQTYRDSSGVLDQAADRFEFSSGEEETARRWLRGKGWSESEPFVCLMVRDSAYLAAEGSRLKPASAGWGYHDYRDSNIGDYRAAVKALLEMGYWVVRLGKVMHEPLAIDDRRVIDYPFLDDRNDLMDVWLPARCTFLASTGSGPDMISRVFRRPIVFVNFIPMRNLWSSSRTITIPKVLRWRESGRFLSLREHLEHAFTRTDEYERAGIEISDQSPEAIADVVLECEGRLSGQWTDTPEDEARQAKFWQALRSWPEFRSYHNTVHPEARVGTDWLRSMGDEFFLA